MAHTVDSRADTPANELRTLLDQAERQLPTLERTGLAAFLLRLDGLEAMLVESAAQGNHPAPRAEEALGELLGAHQSARRRPGAHRQRGTGKFAELRNQHPPAASFWWWLDEQVAVAAAARPAARYRRRGGDTPARRRHTHLPAVLCPLACDDLVDGHAQRRRGQRSRARLGERHPGGGCGADHAARRRGSPALASCWPNVSAMWPLQQSSWRAYSADPDPLRLAVQLGMKQLQAGGLGRSRPATAAAAQRSIRNWPRPPSSSPASPKPGAKSPRAITLFEQAATLAEPDKLELVVTSRMRLAVLLQTGALIIMPEATAPAATTPEATETAP